MKEGKQQPYYGGKMKVLPKTSSFVRIATAL